MSPSLDRLAAALHEHVENLILFEEMDSTHAAALRIMEQLDSEGLGVEETLIVAARQMQGVGRNGRSWISPEGGLYLNWLRSGIDSATIARLPMVAAAAAHAALADFGVDGLVIKWPNDILHNAAKLAGLLIHARHGDTVLVTVGLGLNVSATPPLDVPDGLDATSVADLLGRDVNSDHMATMAADFTSRLRQAIQDPEPMLAHWRRHLLHVPGDTMTVRLASGEMVSGELVEITEEGFLRLATGQGDRVVTGGDVVEGSEQ